MDIIESGDEKLTAELEHDGFVLIDFYANWCGPCRSTMPELEKLAKALPDLKIIKINVDQNKNSALHYQVKSIPQFIILKESIEIQKFAGRQTFEEFKARFEKLST